MSNSTDKLAEAEKSATKQSSGSFWKFLSVLIFVPILGSVLLVALFFVLNKPPSEFPVDKKITVQEGSSARAVAKYMYEVGAVRSDWLLYFALTTLHDPTNIKASTHVFEEPLSLLTVASRLTEGDFDTELISITHIEGETVAKLVERLAVTMDTFDPAIFLDLATPLEGTLSPDTYHIPPTYTEADVVNLLYTRHLEILQELQAELAASSLSVEEVVTLASILEREANSTESMRMVAGILLNRLEINMPLQADATIEYVLDTPISELRPGELAELIEIMDNPYNSYKYGGLPPTPIGNPGKAAIEAVLNPTPSDYLFYITGNDGEFYYAKTHEQHLVNIERHLR